MIFTPVFWLLCAVGCSSFISYNLVRMPALAPFAESLGAGPVAVGWVIAASTLTGVCLKLPMGALSDVISRKKLMTVGILAFALPPFVYPLVTNLEVLTLVRVIHGLATAVFTPLVLATVAAMYPMNRGAALGWFTSAAQSGALIGPMLGGWLVDTSGFSHTFVVAGGFGLLALALYGVILYLQPEVSVTTSGEKRTMMRDVMAGLKAVTGHAQMLATSLAEAAKMMANGTLMAFLPLYGLSIGLSLTEGGMLFGIQGLTSFLSKPVMGRVSDQVGRRPLITVGLVLCGATIMAMPSVSHFTGLLLLAAGFGFGEAVVTSSSAALIADLAKDKNVGAGMGLRGTIMDMGHAGGPIIAGVLVATISYTGAFRVIGCIQLIGAVLFWMVTARHAVLQPVEKIG